MLWVTNWNAFKELLENEAIGNSVSWCFFPVLCPDRQVSCCSPISRSTLMSLLVPLSKVHSIRRQKIWYLSMNNLVPKSQCRLYFLFQHHTAFDKPILFVLVMIARDPPNPESDYLFWEHTCRTRRKYLC